MSKLRSPLANAPVEVADKPSTIKTGDKVHVFGYPKESLIQSLIPQSKILMTMERAFVELVTKEVNLVPVVAESLMKMEN